MRYMITEVHGLEVYVEEKNVDRDTVESWITQTVRTMVRNKYNTHVWFEGIKFEKKANEGYRDYRDRICSKVFDRLSQDIAVKYPVTLTFVADKDRIFDNKINKRFIPHDYLYMASFIRLDT